MYIGRSTLRDLVEAADTIGEGAVKAALADFMEGLPKEAIVDLRKISMGDPKKMAMSPKSVGFGRDHRQVMEPSNTVIANIERVLQKHRIPLQFMGEASWKVIFNYFDTFHGLNEETATISEEKLFLCTYKGVKVEVYADIPSWAKVKAAMKMGIRPEVALKSMTAQEVKREVPIEPMTMSYVDRGSHNIVEEMMKVHGGDMPDKTFDISTDEGIVKALQMISLVDTSISATDSWNVSQRERAASKQNEKLWEKLTMLAKQRKLNVKYSGIGGDYVIDYAKESVDAPMRDSLHENWYEIRNRTIQR